MWCPFLPTTQVLGLARLLWILSWIVPCMVLSLSPHHTGSCLFSLNFYYVPHRIIFKTFLKPVSALKNFLCELQHLRHCEKNVRVESVNQSCALMFNLLCYVNEHARITDGRIQAHYRYVELTNGTSTLKWPYMPRTTDWRKSNKNELCSTLAVQATSYKLQACNQQILTFIEYVNM